MASFLDNAAGPNITPKTTPGGGDARPPYLQMRKPNPVQPQAPSGFAGMTGNVLQQLHQPSQGMFQGLMGGQTHAPGGGPWGPGGPQPSAGSKPVVTPKSTAVPGEVKSPTPGMPPVTPNGAKPPQAGGQNLNDVYKFFQSDLENQKNQALADTRTGAASRGVFYGTPLTGSEADINTQYLRGLGQLQAGMFGDQQQNELQRMQLAANLMGQNGQNAPPNMGGLDFSALGSLFGNSPVASGKRLGPVITPKGTKTGSGADKPKAQDDTEY